MADFYIKKNDRKPSIRAVLTHSDNSGGLLLATSVRFIMRPVGGSTASVASAGVLETVTDTALTARYDWGAGDTAAAGQFSCEWEVSDGVKLETFPNTGYFTVEVVQDLA